VPQDAECFICRSSIEGKGIVRGCACRGTMGLAHVSCLVWQAEMSVKEFEDQGTGAGHTKWWQCFDCGQRFHGAVELALGWAAWKTYVSRPETTLARINSMARLGVALSQSGRRAEALPVLEAKLALNRRYWSHDVQNILDAQSNVSTCLAELGRHNEALVLKREVYARRVATVGVSDKRTLLDGLNLSQHFLRPGLWAEGITLLRDHLLPTARRSLGSDDDITLCLNTNLAAAFSNNPECTRGDLRLNQHESAARVDESQHRRRPARSRDHHARCGPEAAARLRPFASGHASSRRRFVLRARESRRGGGPRVNARIPTQN